LKLMKIFLWITTDPLFVRNAKLNLIFMIVYSRYLKSAIFVKICA
jgi:hypothetical protein